MEIEIVFKGNGYSEEKLESLMEIPHVSLKTNCLKWGIHTNQLLLYDSDETVRRVYNWDSVLYIKTS